MAKLNEGDIIEGIFAIALGIYVADDVVTKERVRSKGLTLFFIL